MKDGPAPSDDEIQAYLDGRLEETDRLRFASYLLANPDFVSRLRQMQRLDDQLWQIGQSILNEPVPDRLRDAVRRSSGSKEE